MYRQGIQKKKSISEIPIPSDITAEEIKFIDLQRISSVKNSGATDFKRSSNSPNPLPTSGSASSSSDSEDVNLPLTDLLLKNSFALGKKKKKKNRGSKRKTSGASPSSTKQPSKAQKKEITKLGNNQKVSGNLTCYELS